MNLIHGDCLEQLKKLADNSIDSLVTDPPAGISFMGKDWDSDKGGRDGWIAWMTQVMTECLRVMKPGAHGLVWALPRSSHWTATALEDAGFEVRDVVTHLFGQGFPKSLNIEKAGAGTHWSGWGTALKPASEHWILVRKPCAEKTVAANVLEWGCGGINIDGSRIETNSVDLSKLQAEWDREWSENNGEMGKRYSQVSRVAGIKPVTGRFPANLVLSHTEFCSDEQCDLECAIKALNEQAKQQASRFFYCAKISSSERNAGLEDMPDKILAMSNAAKAAEKRGETYDNANSGINMVKTVKNNHPTVKPQKLMRYFCRLITPPDGIVLDPFMGSGSTGLAALSESFEFLGIEKEAEYFEIASKRIKHCIPANGAL